MAFDRIASRRVTFHWRDTQKPSTERIGVIAQEVQKVYPQLVSNESKGILGVAYSGLVAPLIEAVKELVADNDKQTKRLDAVEAKFKAYRAAHP